MVSGFATAVGTAKLTETFGVDLPARDSMIASNETAHA